MARGRRLNSAMLAMTESPPVGQMIPVLDLYLEVSDEIQPYGEVQRY